VSVAKAVQAGVADLLDRTQHRSNKIAADVGDVLLGVLVDLVMISK
jgi:hypothetical protein